MKWVKIVLISVFFILFSLFFSCKDIVFNNPLDPNASKGVLDIIRVIDTTLSGAGDIGFDGEKFWKIDLSGNLTAFDRESGIILRSFSSQPGTGVSFLKDRLYSGNAQGDNTLIILDPLSGDLLNRISTRQIYPGFLATYRDQLLIFDVRSSGIFQFNPDTNESVRLFEVSGLNIGGIDIYKDSLLITDMNTGSLYRFSLSGQVMNVFTAPASGVGGVGVDSSDYVYLFMLNGKIYKVSLP